MAIKFEKVAWEQYKKDIEEWAKKCGFDICEAALKNAYENIQLPKRATKGSAGYDFYMPFDIHCEPGEKVKVYTGIKMDITDELEILRVLFLFPRSGLSNKYGMRLSNTVGIIDQDYYNNDGNEGHIMAQVQFDEEYTLKAGERFAQGIVMRAYETDDDDATGKRSGGFGSTGK